MNNIAFKIGLQIIIAVLVISCNRNEREQNPVISTDSIQIYPDGIIIFNGSILYPGSREITDHGFCWSVSSDPGLDDFNVRIGVMASPGTFSTYVSGLSTSTTYYVRAFASSGPDIYYGEERSFITPDTFLLTVKDIDQNIYPTVRIGNQVWMAANLKVTRYSDGTRLKLVEDKKTWYDFNMYAQAYCWYDNFEATGFIYGALYTWPAAMRVTDAISDSSKSIQGVCPDGWHIPSDREWKELEMYLGMSRKERDTTGWRGTVEGGKLKSTGTQYWENPNTGATNESGFNAFAGGWRYGAGYDKDFGRSAIFWTSSMFADNGWIRRLDYNSSEIYRNYTGLYEGHSVRCIKNK